MMVPISEEEIMFVYDAGKLEEGMSDSTRQKLGRTTDFTGKNYSAAKDLILNGKQAEGLEITNEEFGYLASAYELLYSTEGEVVGFVGADYSIREMEKKPSILYFPPCNMGICNCQYRHSSIAAYCKKWFDFTDPGNFKGCS